MPSELMKVKYGINPEAYFITDPARRACQRASRVSAKYRFTDFNGEENPTGQGRTLKPIARALAAGKILTISNLITR